MKDKITIKGAREHNLKNISLEIPRNKMVCFTGLSGSGKSSLAFDTIFAEGQRRYIESLSAYARQFLGQMQKPDVDEIEGLSPAISIDQKAHSRNPRSTVATVTEIYDYLRVLFARIGDPHCPTCNHKIEKLTIDEMTDIVIREVQAEKKQSKNTNEVIILAPMIRGRKGNYYQLLYDLYNSGFAKVRIDGKIHRLSEKIELSRYKAHTIEVIIDTIPEVMLKSPKKDDRQRLSEALERAIETGHDLAGVIYADGSERLLSTKFSCVDCGFSFPEIEPRLFSFNSPYGACPDCGGLGTEEIFSEDICTTCNGNRLRPEAMSVLINGINIVDFTNMTINEAAEFIINIDLNDRTQEIAGTVLKEVENRLTFMLDVGLHYLTLNRKAGSLSGGEAQRIRLASQIGSRLVGALYVLDEPTIGLHQRDNEQLIRTLENLRDIGNTVIVVEHDEDTIRRSDYMVEIGPAAGVHGGQIVAAGPMPEILNDKNSNTAAYLRGDKKVSISRDRLKIGKDAIKIRGAVANNLKNVNVDIPLRRFVCVTGVSGSGKSTLMFEIMYKSIAKKLYQSKAKPGEHKSVLGVEYIDKAILMDQSAIGRSSRSNPATYTGCWTPIRDIFASTEEAKFRGYKVGRFSFNRPGGRCDNCEGHGEIAIEMHFLPTVYVECDVCKGKRFNRETLEVTWNNKNISQVLDLTIEEAVDFFKDVPMIYTKVKTLTDVGLGYLKLGQPAPTLSGGEAQRVKLANELSKRQTGRTLYLLDEPTTGLHFEDIQKLLDVLHKLVEKGNSVIIIEHNLDVIKTSDWIIDLGPEGGVDGGTIVVEGTPEEVARTAESYTGKYLKKMLK
ncbi:excinuclease ABC subunit A [Candidatus Uhrbacteria bacterium CG_4_9_14_3_um_filter_41_35]|uniref:UvrABC system protein A n=1 Tax=Candidatus Uhrbacteria bacterium CG_4_9_14_3_um_filter_41_35 TaxID=1975034 RepID=A0A2M7XFJ0_9BACT|nr:MAG: excinuclease ABC subunit A [Candidatus Uhrbacteria bacterium CG11_big_fil_rev_8_21_14_0_20_41_9]PJA46644.1 MAG: excinuclease ABC subunit A [Candidatus Uhrbacteria bacterium CG_4_9_14_3_um_filter_41_35]